MMLFVVTSPPSRTERTRRRHAEEARDADIMHELLFTETLALANVSLMACEPPYEEGRLPLMLLYGVVLAVGLPANLLTVYLTWLQVCRKNVMGVYLWSLSLCDLTYLGTLPLWTHYVGGGHWWPWSSAACKLTGYIFFNNMYISIFLLCCISCDRYVAVVYSVESRGLRRQRLATLITLAIVLLVAIGHIPVFTMREGDAAEGDRRCFEPSQSSTTVTGFNYARFIIGFLLPLLVLVVTNHGILANVQRSTGLRREQKVRVCLLALAVVVLFLVCFAPYHIILLVRAIIFHFPQLEDGTCLFERTMYTPYTISLGLSTINSAVNPILYVLSSDNIRKELSRVLAQVCARAHLRTRSDSSQNKIPPTRNSSELNILAETERTQDPLEEEPSAHCTRRNPEPTAPGGTQGPLHQEEPRAHCTSRNPGPTAPGRTQGPLHQEEPRAHCTSRNPGLTAPGGTQGPLHQEEPRAHCTRRNPGTTAPGRTQGPLHQEEPRNHCPSRNPGPTATGGTQELLHQDEPRAHCTRRNPGTTALAGTQGPLHQEEPRSHCTRTNPGPTAPLGNQDFIPTPNSRLGYDMEVCAALQVYVPDHH